MQRRIEVVPYDAGWLEVFEKIRRELSIAVGDLAISIEHVGSTSVEGLWAKPIIDIDIVIADDTRFQVVAEKLASIGYYHRGDQGIEGREVFKYQGKQHLMAHHLYVCSLGSVELERHIALRDYLRCHRDAVEEYGRIKREGAERFPDDIDAYIAFKAEFIKGIYLQCDL